MEGRLQIQKAVSREQGALVTRKSSMGLDSDRVRCSSWLNHQV